MAQPAADTPAPGPREILSLLAPFPGRAAIAVRVALICALTLLVTSMYGTPEAAISAYVVFFVNKPDRVSSILTAMAMLVLITSLIALVLVIAMFSVDYSVLRVSWIVVLSMGLLYLTSASKLRPVGAIIAMIVGFGLDQLGNTPFGEAATRGLLYAWLMVAIPIGVSVAINLLIAPSPRTLAGEQLAARLRLAALRLRGDEATRAAFDASLRGGDSQLMKWIKLSKLEGTSAAADVVALRQAAASSTAILVAIDLADREPDARLPARFTAPLAATLDDMATLLQQGGYPVDIALTLPATDALPPLAQIVVTDLRIAITRFAEPGDADGAAPTPARQAPPEPRGGFFLPGAHTNPEHVRYALKTTAAAMFCYLLYMQLDWPGIHTCFITCYMVSLGTTAETVEKLTLRIAGCIAGALLGTAALVFAVPSLTSISELMALVFAGAFVSAWIAFGSPRIAYAGLQVAFAFFLCVIQGAGPGFDLTLARDRVIGILLGNVVVYLVFTRVWPVSIGKQVDAAFAALLAQWRRIVQIADPAERRAGAADAFARYDAIAQDIGLIHYEPSWVRPAPAWVDARRRALAELGALEAPLFLLAERAPGDAAIGAQLARVSNAFATDSDETAHRTATAPGAASSAASPSASPLPPSVHETAAADARRDALLNLIDARLAIIADDARRAVPKEPLPHART